MPFFLSAVFFLSAIFAVFAPVPLFLLYFRSKLRFFHLANFSNLLIIFFASGAISAVVYFIFVNILTYGLCYFIFKRGYKPDKASVLTLLLMIATVSIGTFGFGWSKNVSVWNEVKTSVSKNVEKFIEVSGPEFSRQFGDIPDEKIPEMVIQELPAVFFIFSLLMIWANLVMIFRVNPVGIMMCTGADPSYLRTWKTPEWLIWPVIISGALLIFGKDIYMVIGQNGIKIFLIIYGLQGLSILSYVLNRFKVKPLIKTIFYVMIAFFITPLLIAVGFFDLWFDFRAKLRQS